MAIAISTGYQHSGIQSTYRPPHLVLQSPIEGWWGFKPIFGNTVSTKYCAERKFPLFSVGAHFSIVHSGIQSTYRPPHLVLQSPIEGWWGFKPIFGNTVSTRKKFPLLSVGAHQLSFSTEFISRSFEGHFKRS